MTYLLDTDWAISFLNGKARAVELVDKLADEGIALSIITWGEIYEGLLTSSAPERHQAQLDAFTSIIDLLTLNTEVARHYGSTRSQLRTQGLLIPDNDLWIAATALAHNLTLVSRDEHFTRIPDLKLYPPN